MVFGALTRWAALRPFRHRDFRLLWVALAVSLIGDGVWLVAVPWQVISLGAGPAGLALVVGAGSVGILLSLFLGGVLADLLPRRTVLVTTSGSAALVVLTLVGLAELDRLTVPVMAVAAFLLAALDGISGPAVETLIPVLVPGPELQAAYGLESLLSSIAARAVGPAIGGAAVLLAGPVGALLIDAVSFLLAGLLFLALRGGRTAAVRRAAAFGVRSVVRDFRAATAFVGRQPWLWSGIGWAALALFVQTGPRQVLLPFLVVDRLDGDASEFGLLLAGYGVSATIGALVAAGLPSPQRYLSVMFGAWALGSLPFAFLPFAGHLVGAILLMGLAGFFLSLGNVFWSTVAQRRVPADLRGRVTSLDWFGSLALVPVSLAVAGTVGPSGSGLTAAFVLAGAFPAVLAAGFLLFAGLRRDEQRNPLQPNVVPV